MRHRRVAPPSATWYVAQTGDNTNNCTSDATPCKTIAGAIGKAAAGDTVQIAGGEVVNLLPTPYKERITLNKNLTLLGAADGLSTILDGSAGGVVVTVNSGVTATISKLVITNGKVGSTGVGAGVTNNGTLTLTDSKVAANTAGASGAGIYNNGTLTVSKTLFTANTATGLFNGRGGALYNNTGATLTVRDSTFLANSAIVEGGAVYSKGSAKVLRSILNANSAAKGGGVFAGGGTAAVISSTLTSNTGVLQGGALHNAGGTVTVINSTVMGNLGAQGAGVYAGSGGSVTIKNSIVAKQTGADCGGSGTLTNGGYNLESGTSCKFSDANSKQSVADLKMGALQLNGGPTGTYGLLAGSPAINGGAGAVCASDELVDGKDQRGYPRSRGASCDIGAVEALLVNDTGDAADAAPGDMICLTGGGKCSLRAAVQTANAEGGDIIVLPAGVYTLSLTGADEDAAATGDLDLTSITGYVTVTATDAVTTIIQGAANTAGATDRVFDLRPGSFADLLGVTVRHGKTVADNSGGGIKNQGAVLHLGDGVVTYNAAGGNGGGINNNTGALSLDNVIVSENTAVGDGGGILNFTGVMTINGGSVINNAASGTEGGGGIANTGLLTVTKTTIAGNTTAGSGGGIGAAGLATMTGVTVTGNTAAGGGGIGAAASSIVTVTN
ncbi:MAG: hypothetical protein NTZ05_05165, partial [Chloroflexi bacterium]|nr:hypothetical protein [Chloroflexota bacterium]